MDRGYLDFRRLYAMHQAGAFFVTRAKSNFVWRRLYSAAIDRSAGLACDHIIVLEGRAGRKRYPKKSRRIKFDDPEPGKPFVFLTNNFTLPASTICALYKMSWQVKPFFKWTKQHLRIKRFFGMTENAVKTQIWISVSVYVLIAIIKKRLGLDASLYTFLQIFSPTLFEKMAVSQALQGSRSKSNSEDYDNQLNLFRS